MTYCWLIINQLSDSCLVHDLLFASRHSGNSDWDITLKVECQGAVNDVIRYTLAVAAAAVIETGLEQDWICVDKTKSTKLFFPSFSMPLFLKSTAGEQLSKTLWFCSFTLSKRINIMWNLATWLWGFLLITRKFISFLVYIHHSWQTLKLMRLKNPLVTYKIFPKQAKTNILLLLILWSQSLKHFCS